ncbi:hypothetical protein [Prevotella sp. 10(H)]|uniref:LIC_10190 family membrane protein n=1 Tax=Prevotella sp. 10(H) TaxID=1158294 RepID=UPI0004A783BA|nr:hypothetical protein [Prevotella sp. 10(H)]
MLVNLLSWIVIFFVLFSFGDILLSLYNKVRRQKEEYNLLDRLLIGLCSLIIPLSVWSLWLPSNQIFLCVILIISAVYWIIWRKRASSIFENIKGLMNGLSQAQKVVLLSFILFTLYFFSWQQEVYDSLFYHYQNIRWNEEYAVVPGVANLDDRFGFNSNYFLLSAVFTFRFLLHEAVYPLQPLIVTAIGCWILYQVFVSKYEVKRVVILITYLLLFWVSITFLGNTSTDILPNFILFYIVARIILYPQLLKDNYLLGFMLPVFLLTCKLSFFPVGLISLYLLYMLIKQKKYKVIVFLCLISLLILVPWLVRNVIISGYIIYPLYQLDLFSFDWKVPKEVAIREKDYIFEIGYYFFRTAVRYPHESVRDPLVINILTSIIYLLSLLSLVVMTYLSFRKRRSTEVYIKLLFAVFLLTIVVWMFGGPDIRFVAGVLCALIMTAGVLFVRNSGRQLSAYGKTTVAIFLIGLLLWPVYCYHGFQKYTKDEKDYPLAHILVKPYSVIDQHKAKGLDITADFIEYKINNGQSMWISKGFPYDMPPPVSIGSHYSKFLPIECVEARGDCIQSGYRPKPDCR